MTALMVPMTDNLPGTEMVGKFLASESLVAGAFVTLWNNAGVINLRNAIATDTNHLADGFVLDDTLPGMHAMLFTGGLNDQLSGLTMGAMYYLSDVTPGGMVTTMPPAMPQFLGRALSATAIFFQRIDGLGGSGGDGMSLTMLIGG